MKITKNHLRRIIQESIEEVVAEMDAAPLGTADDQLKFGQELLTALKKLGSGAASMSTFAFTYVPAIAQGRSVTRDPEVVNMVQDAIKKYASDVKGDSNKLANAAYDAMERAMNKENDGKATRTVYQERKKR